LQMQLSPSPARALRRVFFDNIVGCMDLRGKRTWMAMGTLLRAAPLGAGKGVGMDGLSRRESSIWGDNKEFHEYGSQEGTDSAWVQDRRVCRLSGAWRRCDRLDRGTRSRWPGP